MLRREAWAGAEHVDEAHHGDAAPLQHDGVGTPDCCGVRGLFDRARVVRRGSGALSDAFGPGLQCMIMSA